MAPRRRGDYDVRGLDADGALTFAAEEHRQTFTVLAMVDADGVDEELVLGFGGVVPAGSTPTTVVTLQEGAASGGIQPAVGAGQAAPVRVRFEAAEYRVEEGGPALTITALLEGESLAEAVTIPLAVTPQGDTAPDRYTVGGLSDGGLRFAVGQTAASFTITANQDPDGNHETVLLGFGALPAGIGPGQPAGVDPLSWTHGAP